jgi:predicted DNA-binding transcriptional regulator YafY
MKEDALLKFNAPIKFSKSNNGYYYADPNYTIKKIQLQPQDIESLRSAIEMLSMYTGSRVSAQFNAAVDKVLAAVHAQQPQGRNKKRIIQSDTSQHYKGFQHFETFLHAATHSVPVCFIHYSYNNRNFKSVILHPVFLKEFQNRWYVVGFSEKHGELRTFGLDRIYEPKLLKREFKETDEQITNDYFKHIYGVYPFRDMGVQEIEFTVVPVLSDYLNAFPIHESQERVKELHKGNARFRLNLIPSVELISLFFSYTGQLYVHKPVWIREHIEETLENAIIHEKNRRRQLPNQ